MGHRVIMALMSNISDVLPTDEDQAWLLLEAVRWPNGAICPSCGNTAVHFVEPTQGHRRTVTGKVSHVRIWDCRVCDTMFSVLRGTVLADTKIPLVDWLQVVALMEQHMSGLAISKQVSASYQGTWTMIQRIKVANINSNDIDPLKRLMTPCEIPDYARKHRMAVTAKTAKHAPDRKAAISAKHIATLADRITCNDSEAKRYFLDYHQPLVAGIAQGYLSSGAIIADLITAGNEGLLRAVASFDVNVEQGKGHRFSAYAFPYIHVAMQQYAWERGAPRFAIKHKDRREYREHRHVYFERRNELRQEYQARQWRVQARITRRQERIEQRQKQKEYWQQRNQEYADLQRERIIQREQERQERLELQQQQRQEREYRRQEYLESQREQREYQRAQRQADQEQRRKLYQELHEQRERGRKHRQVQRRIARRPAKAPDSLPWPITSNGQYFTESRQLHPLTGDELAALVAPMLQGDMQARQRVIEGLQGFIISIANSFRYVGIDLTDLVAEGNIALLDAIEVYDPVKHGDRSFSKYVYTPIRRAMQQLVCDRRSPLNMPAYIATQATQVRRVGNDLASSGVAPTTEAIAKAMGASPDRVRTLYDVPQHFLSLDMPMNRTGDNDISLLDVIPMADYSQDRAEQRRQQAQVADLLSVLNKQEREVISVLYGVGDVPTLTREELANWMGCDTDDVAQVEQQAMQKLRATPMPVSRYMAVE